MGTIKSFKKFIEESIWSDIQDRSMGKTVRKEDDINLLDKDGLYEYLISHYKPLENIDIKSCISCGKSHISLCVFIYPKQTVYSILLDILNCRVKVRTPYIKRWPTNLLDMIDKKYYREDVIDSNRDHMTFITPKEGKGNNQFYIDFLDMILNNVDKPFLKKVINESIWSDIQDRSMGKTVRKEDERHIYLERLLATYIKLFAESCHYHDEYTYCSYPDFRSYIKDFRDNPRIEEVCPNDSYFDDLLDYVNKETWDNQIFDTVVEISQRIVHGEHPITDDVIKELRKHNVNESIWSDIQDRSMGKTVRKEDEMTSDDFLMLRGLAEMFRNVVKRSGNTFWKNTCDNFIKYIEQRKEEHFWNDTPNETYDKVIRFVQKNWGNCTDIQEFMDKYLSNINECDGVPGGLTPTDVGGMGPAYFPGPNGEPGSGDLPSPTGIVYKQVAPFDSFIKIRKQKKKKKKFRKEDEPCAKYDNHPVCKHIDDFRDYVDRTYNNIDKRK